MAKDTLTLKLSLTADSQTIQTAHRLFNDLSEKTILALRLQEAVENFLSDRRLGDFTLSSVLSVSRVSVPKKATYPPPLLKNGIVTIWDYEHSTDFFTVIKEQRRGRPVWYARRIRGKLKRFYLGLPQNLTGDKLATVAQKMSRQTQKNLTA